MILLTKIVSRFVIIWISVLQDIQQCFLSVMDFTFLQMFMLHILGISIYLESIKSQDLQTHSPCSFLEWFVFVEKALWHFFQNYHQHLYLSLNAFMHIVQIRWVLHLASDSIFNFKTYLLLTSFRKIDHFLDSLKELFQKCDCGIIWKKNHYFSLRKQILYSDGNVWHFILI